MYASPATTVLRLLEVFPEYVNCVIFVRDFRAIATESSNWNVFDAESGIPCNKVTKGPKEAFDGLVGKQ